MADVRLLSEIRITIRNLGGGSDDDSGPAKSVVRKDGPFDRWGFSSRFAAARSATISGPVIARGEPMQIIFSRVMYLRWHHKTGNVAAE